MSNINPKSGTANTGKKDFWITTDLGLSNIYYIGVYLYYPQGSYLAKKLADAGATGVIVKWQSGSATGILLSYEKKSLPASTFDVPSNFTLMEH